ncbi:hypothetical protein BS47DRAFT_906641 [Hydnum rufescens UP504]|uniref:Zinc finger Mcm10/DnaG-type domain-containing protein n=1 Tax=Hydnum rufescens UP504 TaxID=1448309 RepID=A0A9P6ABV2_9AGAM|nr:hypothetical protein BS47DRAFT_906641 [Hydnum rufescens UP504]
MKGFRVSDDEPSPSSDNRKSTADGSTTIAAGPSVIFEESKQACFRRKPDARGTIVLREGTTIACPDAGPAGRTRCRAGPRGGEMRTHDTRVPVTPSISPKKESKDTHGIYPSRRLSAPVFKRTADKEKRSDLVPTVTRPSQVADALDQLNHPKTEVLAQTVLPVGPPSIDYPPPFDDPHFKRHELNSHINIYFSHKSHLCNVIIILMSDHRSSPMKTFKSILEADTIFRHCAWDRVTIAVIAECGPISVSRAKSTADSSGDGPKKTSGCKYLTLKLVDFGHTGSDSQSSKAVIKGDAVLNLILFEADSYSTIRNSDGLSDRVYRGGSGRAFEACANFRQGTVIAILNSKILKPFQKGAAKPHPTDNVLALTPENASSIVIIGQSRDLGTCHALKRDGKQCGSWCDLRVSEICEYHIQHSIQSRRASRPEFSTGLGPSRVFFFLFHVGLHPE